MDWACRFYAKRLERGRFLLPSLAHGAVRITQPSSATLLEGIDWRMPHNLATAGGWLIAGIESVARSAARTETASCDSRGFLGDGRERFLPTM